MKKEVLINEYVVLMQEYYQNCSKNITNVEVQIMSNYFDRVPYQHQKPLFMRCVKECEFFPKLSKVTKIYDDYLRIKRKETTSKKRVNEEYCEVCQDKGLVAYYSDGVNSITRDEYYRDFKKYRGSYDKYMCACFCNVGESKASENIAGYQFERSSENDKK